MGVLYVVATPIGNLEDITHRAVRILKEVSLIAAEDTRQTRRLLNCYNIRTPMTSYFEHNKKTKLENVLNHLKEEDVALVSDAGTPGLNDPGYELIVRAIECGIKVEPIPGSSVILTALVVSGLPTDRFVYVGYLPRKSGERRHFSNSTVNESATLIALETPHRLRRALSDLLDILGDRRIAVCRELTKVHEEIYRGTLSQAVAYFVEPRGEFALVIEGNRQVATLVPDDDILRRLRRMYQFGMKAKEAIAEVSRDSGISRKQLYQAWLELSSPSNKVHY